MRRFVLIGGILAVAAVLMVLLLPPLMRVRSPEEVVPILARQELREFYLYFGVFKDRHGKPPASVEELLADGKYLKGVVEPHRTKILRRLEYPVVAHSLLAAEGPVLAAYRVAGFGDFFVITNGDVVEKRMRDYSVSSYRRVQKREAELIKIQLDGAANRSKPIRAETNSTRAAAGSRR